MTSRLMGYHLCSGGYCMDIMLRCDDDGTFTVVEPKDASEGVIETVRKLEERHRHMKTAEARAKEMLVRLLTDEQRETFQSGYINVTGSCGGAYRIYCGESYSGNIVSFQKNGERRGSYCAHPEWGRDLPRHDMFLGQLLLLTCDEPTFLKVAVFYRAYPPGA